ncbi:MAG TPA: ThuA domain-containing protein [Haliangiales bacterium]|nr:ThuA domain-containing protein [Haliangiales bacterium]
MPCSPGQGLFGPKWWEGDAFIAGESRGKIWRVRLVKTPHGYVGKEFLIARLNRLTVDLAISPKGDLYVCCHSGLPDWGTGPKGEGKIFKISYTDPKAPQPVMAWAAGPTEVRVAFDKPLDPSVTNAVLLGSSRVGGNARDPAAERDRRSSRDVLTNTATNFIEFGEYVRAADRYEVIKPPYQVVKKQEAAPRGRLKIEAAHLDDDQQTLVLTTEPHSRPVTYALTIPGVKARRGKDQGQTVDVDYDLSGVAVLLAKRKLFMDWEPVRDLARKAGMKTSDFIWNDWLPYAGVEFARLFAGPSKYFAEADRRLSTGTGFGFKVLARLNMPAADATLRVKSAAPFRLMVPGAAVMITNSIRSSDGNQFADLAVTGEVKDSFLAVSWKGGAADAAFTYFTRGDPTERPLRPGFLFSPWFVEGSEDETDTESAQKPASSRNGADNLGGDYERGRSLFVSDPLKCSTCHRLRGEGGTIGPDLSNLVSRDAASVLRDIREPSASINPDYVAYNVLAGDGSELTGFVRAQDNAFIKLLGADGKELIFRPTEVKEMRVSSVSLMPTGLIDGLKEEQVHDLLTFLLNEPPQRSTNEPGRLFDPQPATRNNAENRKSQIANRKLEIVLVASKQDHGPGQHDYPAWQQTWLRLLTSSPSNVTATAAWEWPTEDQFRAANAIVFYYWNHDWNPERYRQLDEYLERGGGVVLFHSATIADKDPEQLAERIGLASQPQRTKYLHTPLDLKIVAAPDHPITIDLPRQIHFLDEPYWPMIGDPSKIEPLATVNLEGQDWPMIWTFQKGKGRVFASILGHYTWTHEDPVFRLIAMRGLAWAAGEPVGRFENLIPHGAVSR